MLGNIKSLAIVGLAVGMFGLAGYASASGAAAKSTSPMKVIYHVNDSANAVDAMRNASNHLETDPTAKLTFVTHAKGVDFLLEGAMDKDGNPYNIAVEKLIAKGVTFDICSITLSRRKIDPKTALPGVKFVPSGVVELAKLQAQEGFVYIKP